MLGQGELAARLAQAIDDFDGDDVGGRHGLFALGHMLADDVVEAEELPEPACQPHIAEAAGIAPTDLAEADADDIGIVGQGSVLVFGKEPEFLSVALAVVKDDGALPTPFLIVIEFAEMSDDALAWPSIGAVAVNSLPVAFPRQSVFLRICGKLAQLAKGRFDRLAAWTPSTNSNRTCAKDGSTPSVCSTVIVMQQRQLETLQRELKAALQRIAELENKAGPPAASGTAKVDQPFSHAGRGKTAAGPPRQEKTQALQKGAPWPIVQQRQGQAG